MLIWMIIELLPPIVPIHSSELEDERDLDRQGDRRAAKRQKRPVLPPVRRLRIDYATG
jgi:hypothetical protein